MAIEDRISQVQALLGRLRRYTQLVISDGFTEETLDELKGNAKSICDEAKAEIDLIKIDIGNWT